MNRARPLSLGVMSSVILFLVAVPGCHLSSLPLWTVPTPSEPSAIEIEEVQDIAYYTGSDADDFRHRLDLYLPKGIQNFPVVVLVHGGAWGSGDKCQYGLFSSVGRFLAQQGIGAVLPNYRISPDVKHPEHVRDVARAVAWTSRTHCRTWRQPRSTLSGRPFRRWASRLLACDR